MITLRDASLRRGTKLLFENANALLPAGAKVGLVGRNGSGKSSLFDALLGHLSVDTGAIDIAGTPAIAVLRQEVPSTTSPAIEYVKDGDTQLRDIERALADTTDGNRLGELHGALDAIDGYTADARAAKLIIGLGFDPGEIERPVEAFSGGWRMRLNLAQALMCRSDLLLLDEPTNHLDFEAVVWLEAWLRQYPGTLLVISHDREFLDNVVARVLHLEANGMQGYTGNYSDFERVRAERIAFQESVRNRQVREVKRITRFVERFRAKATKARQAQSRLKALERMELVSVVHGDSPFSFEFPATDRCPDPLLGLRDVTVSYPGVEPVLRGVNLTLTPGQRLGLLGFNGAGKSTLMRTLAGLHAPDDGERIDHPGVKIGYFAQHQLELLDLDATPLLHHKRRYPQAREQRLRDFLGGFGFGGEMADAKVGNFSGGEKSRLVLSMLVADAPNILLLDEPTNHLDMDMRHTLEVALQDFAGALVLVSHDRHLLRTTTDELLLVANGQAIPFAGDLDDYGNGIVGDATTSAPHSKLSPKSDPTDDPSASTTPSTAGQSGSDSVDERREARRRAAHDRARLRPVTERIKRIEKLIAKLTAERSQLDEALAKAEIYQPENKGSLTEHLFNRARIDQQIDELEQEWLELEEQLESS
jgi:ATP-binding cassette subfamily F protein 3